MVTIREVLRGAMLRVLPAAVAVAVALRLTMEPVHGSVDLLSGALLLPATAGALGLAVGYAAALASMRRRLRADAAVAGRRAVVSGAVGPLLMLAVAAAW